MADDVEKFLSEQRAIEEKRKALIEDLLKKKDAAIREFDDQLARLGHSPDGSTPRRSHKAKRPAVKASDIKAKEKEPR